MDWGENPVESDSTVAQRGDLIPVSVFREDR